MISRQSRIWQTDLGNFMTPVKLDGGDVSTQQVSLTSFS